MRAVFGTFAITAVLSLIATPVFRMLALRWGLVDNPDGHRKLHENRTAVSGGVPVFLTAIIGVVIALLVPNRWQPTLLADTGFLWGILLASSLIVLIGVLDDARGMRGRQKLLGQIIVAGIMVGFGLQIEKLSLLGNVIPLGVASIPFTMFWLLGAINAFNLIDGVDGLASSLGLIISLGLAGMAAMYGHGAYALFAVALAGSLAGFLVYNFPPARIFLGDSGSMLIGLLLGVLAIKCSLKGPATAALVVPTAIWTIPIFDVAMAILRRKMTGKSLYETDRGHLHHRLIARGVEGPKLLLGVGLLCAVAGLGALGSMALNNEYLALGSATLVILILVVTRSFGHTELGMLARRVKHLAASFAPHRRLRDSGAQPLQAHLQGHREWDQLWELLIDFAERFNIDSIELNVSMPAIGEEYHAKWSLRANDNAEQPVFRTDIPLVFENSLAGRLRVSGFPGETHSVCAWGQELMVGLKPFEAQMLQLIRSSEVTPDDSSRQRLKVG